MSNRAWSIVDITAMVLIPGTVLAAGQWAWLQEQIRAHPTWLWVWMGALLLAFAIALGLSKDRGILGVLVDETNRVSLARFQAAIWGALLLSALAAAVAIHLARECEAPPPGVIPPAGGCAQDLLDLALPRNLLALAGLSAAVLIIGTILQTIHAQRRPSQVAALPEPYLAVGIVAAKTAPGKATLGDLVRGELVTTCNALDLTRIQQMAVSLVLAGLYAGAFWPALQKEGAIRFPDIDTSLIVLLTLSAATYLGVKAVRGLSVGA